MTYDCINLATRAARRRECVVRENVVHAQLAKLETSIDEKRERERERGAEGESDVNEIHSFSSGKKRY